MKQFIALVVLIAFSSSTYGDLVIGVSDGNLPSYSPLSQGVYLPGETVKLSFMHMMKINLVEI